MMTRNDALYLVHHIMLPPQLPHKSDLENQSGHVLLDITYDTLVDFRNRFVEYQGFADSLVTMLSRMRTVHSKHPSEVNHVLELELRRALSGLVTSGGCIPLCIGAQNAGIVISKVDHNVHFEMFELAPTNSAVIATKGRLRRSFPGSAIAIDHDTFDNPDFLLTIAQSLAQMSHQAAPGLQPKVRKATQMHNEDRDTTHPGMVTEFFNGFLSAIGVHIDLEPIAKNTRDEVFYKSARSPWRRSPLWLLVRVSLQLCFSRFRGQRNLYKDFMVLLMSRVLEISRDMSIPTDLLYAMNAKLARRLMKMKCINPKISEAVLKVMSQTHQLVSDRWKNIRDLNTRHLDLSALSALDFEHDSHMSVQALDDYIEERSKDHRITSRASFYPFSKLEVYEPGTLPATFGDQSDAGTALQNLHGFEDWISSCLAAWTAAHMDDPSSCVKLAQLTQDYHAVAIKQYGGNPEAISVLLLIVMELWVACDSIAISLCNLLAEYRPGIISEPLQNLLLPFKSQMRRLHKVEQHVDRRSRARLPTTMLYQQPHDENSFSARYFDQSENLRGEMQKITVAAEFAKLEKLEEFREKKEEYSRLIGLYNQTQCEYNQIVVDHRYGIREERHSSSCQKCRYQQQASNVRIAVHEWPLPQDGTKAKTIVFELFAPSWFCHWRDTCVYLQSNILGAKYQSIEKPRSIHQFSSDPHLSRYRTMYTDETPRISLLSQDKPHVGTHRKGRAISTASEDDICVHNGLNYFYYDNTIQSFVRQFSHNDSILHACTYKLPGHSVVLQDSLFRPARSPDGITPNMIVAGQSWCPDHMTLNEFKELCSIPVGYLLQWLNIAAQLAMPSVDLKKTETSLVVLQCIYQAGPPSKVDSILRKSHTVVNDDSFAKLLLEQLYKTLRRIEQNWESLPALGMLVAIARRMISLSSSQVIQIKVIEYLREASGVAYRWMEHLKNELQNAKRSDRPNFLSKTAEAALTCASCFDVERDILAKMLKQTTSASIFLQCCIVIRRGKETLLSSTELPIRCMFMRHQRLLLDSCTTLITAQEAIDDAMQKAWAAYRPGLGWTVVGSARHWIVSRDNSNVGEDDLGVHYNILDGELLVDGVPIDRLPTDYERHASYRALFGQISFEVVPSNVPGMRFCGKERYRGYLLNFGLSDPTSSPTDLLIQASNELTTYKLFPSRLLRRHVPDFFVDNFIHWYDCNTSDLEVRPITHPWDACSSERLLLIRCEDGSWQLMFPKNGAFLVSAKSRTAVLLADILSPLANPLQIHISVSRALSPLEIEIPGIGLGFSLPQGSALIESREHREMFIDENQLLETLVGYRNKLILKNQRTFKRVVVLLEGHVSFSRTLHLGAKTYDCHVNVESERKLFQNTYSFWVDERLGRLVGNGGLQSLLFLAHLHALTSFCLPDPLTCRTGTEQALSILDSAGVRSFDQLNQDNIDMLTLIANITPKRCCYPANLRVMQTVDWCSQLSFLSQHPDFYKIVVSIFDQARRSALFHPESVTVVPLIDGVDESLLERDCIRSSAFRVSEFGAEAHTTSHDITYKPRDRETLSARRESAFVLSSLINQGRQTFHWGQPDRGFLWSSIKGASKAYGTDRPFDVSWLRYDASTADEDENFVLRNWASLHKELSRAQEPSVNKFALMMWLSSLACFNSVRKSILETLGIFYTRKIAVQSRLPMIYIFQVDDGHQVSIARLRELIRQYVRADHLCPAYNTPREHLEDKSQYARRRRDLVRGKQDSAVQILASKLQQQWPCEKPSTPTITDPAVVRSYIHMENAMNAVQRYFQSSFNNLQYFRYLQALEVELLRLDNVAVHIPQHTLPIPEFRSSGPGYMSTMELFKYSAPTLQGSNGLETSTVSQLRREGTVFHVTSFLSQLQMGARQSQYEVQYIYNLRSSLAALQGSGRHCHRSDLPHVGAWLDRVALHTETLTSMNNTLISAMTHISPSSICSSSEGARIVSQMPRLGPLFFLQQLRRDKWQLLSPDWRRCIVLYGVTITSLQRAERLAGAYSADRHGDLLAELENIGHRNWDPMDYPESLLLEIESGIIIRDVQEQIASEMRMPQSGLNTTMQMMMGEGKSSVIVPITAISLADQTRLVRVISGRPQSRQMAQMLISKLGGLLNRRVYYMPFSRSIKFDQTIADTVYSMCRECMENGGILLLQPEHILSFQLMILDRYISGQEPTGQSLLSVQDFFDEFSRDIIDESDENFNVKFELIYTIGMQRQIDMSPDRWTCIHEILDLVEKIAPQLEREFPSSMEIKYHSGTGFPRIRILCEEVEPIFVERLGRQICQLGLKGFPIIRQPPAVREAIFKYISRSKLREEEIQDVEGGEFWTDDIRQKLYLLRGLLTGGVLAFSFARKRWRVDYGLDSNRSPPTRLAVPYRAKDLPTARSEFSHPDVVVLMTSLSYYYGGLEDEQMFITFQHLLVSDQKDLEYQAWVRRSPKLPPAFRQLQEINLKDRAVCVSKLFPALRHVKSVVDYYLSNIIFPKEMREFPYKLSASGWDVGKIKTHPTTGFSGTCDSQIMLPLHVTHVDLPEQKHTNALVLEYLLGDENSVMELPPMSDGNDSNAEQLLSSVMGLEPSPRVILDVGAQILELDNLGVARKWLEKYSDNTIQAVVFFNDNDELAIIDRKGKVEALQISSYADQLDLCAVFLDEAHTRGTDLKLPLHWQAAVTLGPNMTKDRLVQACMRMRKLGKGQSVVFCVTKEIQKRIRDCVNKTGEDGISVSDILRWAISETCLDIRRSMPLWAVQGKNFIHHNRLWKDIQVNPSLMCKTFAERFLEEEAQSLESRYRPSPPEIIPAMAELEIDSSHDMSMIVERYHRFDDLQSNGSALQEEQERELSPEMEQERQVQRPDPAIPAAHYVHPDIQQFVSDGTIFNNSEAYVPAFNSLSEISAASMFDVAQLIGDGRLLVTKDFERTVEKEGGQYKSDAYLRSVQWVLTSALPGTSVVGCAIIISPYEAQKLIPSLIKGSAVVLHIYKPWWNLGYASMDELEFFSIPALTTPRKLPPTLKAQLNLFAGQLYFSSLEDYIATCGFLGLATMEAKSGCEIAPDGFIVKDETGTCGARSGLHESPIVLVKALTHLRMNSGSIFKTHMGKLLDGALLTEEDFDGC